MLYMIISALTLLCNVLFQEELTAENFVIAVGGRPRFPVDVSTVQEFLTSQGLGGWMGHSGCLSVLRDRK